MSAATLPVFVIGTGRSGTRSIFKMLSGHADVEIHHEYVCTHVQKLAALYYMGLVDKAEAKRQLMELHGAAIRYSDARVWIDSSNKLSWLIEPLAELFPQARFLALARDGRKVVSSFFYKLSEEMYDDASTSVLRAWLEAPADSPIPPPEKKYWWNIPRRGQPQHDAFPRFDRLERVAWHWGECNRVILRDFERLRPEQRVLVRLEDITQDEARLRESIEFMHLPYDASYAEFLKTPQNVFFPMDFQLTDEQLKKFWALCAPMMKTLGYAERESYVVRY